jgi:hypothetical protein
MNMFPFLPRIFFFCAVACVVAYNYFEWRLVRQVNSKLGRQERFLPVFWYPGKPEKLREQYARLFPGSRLPYWMDSCIGLAAIFFLAAVVSFMLSFLIQDRQYGP